MTVIYVDTSAVVRAYLGDEAASDSAATVLFASRHPVVTSELTRVEFASALIAAVRAKRLPNATPILSQFDQDCAEDGPLALLPMRRPVLAAARELLLTNGPLRTLDALHIAVALTDAAELSGDGDVAFLTYDERRAVAARSAGLAGH